MSISGSGNGRLTLTIKSEDGHQEIWRNLSTEENDPRYIVKVLSLNDESNENQTTPSELNTDPFDIDPFDPESESIAMATQSRSILVKVQKITLPTQLDRQMACLSIQENQVRRFGAVGLTNLEPKHFYSVTANDQKLGLPLFEEIDEISMIAMPDIAPINFVEPQYRQPAVRCHDLVSERLPKPQLPYRPEFPKPFSQEAIVGLYRKMLAHCAEQKGRIAIFDSWAENVTPHQLEAWRNPEKSEELFIKPGDKSYYGAFYYPWILAPDPLQSRGGVRAVPPSGYVAGMIARVDQRSGVHKPPANELAICCQRRHHDGE